MTLTRRTRLLAAGLALSTAVGLGLISYPLYLWHWPLLSFATLDAAAASPVVRMALVGASVLLAWALYDAHNRPLTICLNVYLFVSLFSVLALGGSIFVWEREGRKYRTSHPDRRGPLHN